MEMTKEKIASLPVSQWSLKARCAAARDIYTHPNILSKIAEAMAGEADEIAINLAINENCPAAALEKIAAKCQSVEAKILVAKHQNVNERTLNALVNSRDPAIRGAIGSNRRTPQKILEILARDPSDEIRAAVASNPNIPPKLVRKLEADPSHRVRRGLITNPAITKDEDLRRLTSSLDSLIRRGVVGNPCCPAEVLSTLSFDENDWVRGGVARHGNTPDKIIDQLSTDDSPWVRFEILMNKNTTITTLAQISSEWKTLESFNKMEKELAEWREQEIEIIEIEI